MLDARRRVRRARNRLTNKSALRTLGNLDHPEARPLTEALGAALGNRLTEAERQRLDAIEELRARVELSGEVMRQPVAEWSGDPADERVLEETVGDLCRLASKGPRSAVVLLALIRHFRPARCLELGTCLGISSAYQAAALALNGHGTLVSMDASSVRLKLAKSHLDELGYGEVDLVPGRFQDALDSTLDALGQVDYAFIDGHHDEDATIDYFHRLLPHLSPSALLVFDDIRWSEGMERAWESVHQHSAIGISVDTRDMGICVLGQPKAPLISLPIF